MVKRKENFDAILLEQKKYAKTFNTLPQKSTLYSNTINMLNFSIHKREYNKAFYNNTNQLRKCVIGPEVQIIPLEIIIHPF